MDPDIQMRQKIEPKLGFSEDLSAVPGGLEASNDA
jgi:hypothetical protein